MVNTQSLDELFTRVFPNVRPMYRVRAPGRVNLIGEHTDYNDGFVLPVAMSQALTVLAAPADDGQVMVHTTAFNETVSFPAKPTGRGEPAWSNYVRGVTALLAEQGVQTRGARLLIHSDVPIGGGVSSSAALEVGTARAILAVAGREMDGESIALLAQRAEHEYAGMPCGIMDQFISTLGKAGHALLLDCRTRGYEHIPLRLADTVLVIMDTQVKHQLGSSEYPVRRRQCGEGVEALRRFFPQVRALRDVSADMLNPHEADMDPVIFRRCRHVVTEIERTLLAAEALRADRLERFGQLMYESHASLRDDYQVSCPELDHMVEVAGSVNGVYGARMTGGGFGGCVIGLVRTDALQALRTTVERHYNSRFAKPGILYTTVPSDGAEVERL